MAGKAKEKTKLEIAGEAARDKTAKAKEALVKLNNPTNKKAYDDAKALSDAATKAENRERFKIIGSHRVKTVSAKIKAFTNCARRQSYEYGAGDVEKAFAKMRSDLDAGEAKFKDALAGNKTVASDDGFAFE